jgi:complement component 1 Q subcomponent-binding protein, mitochondrial
MLSLDSTSLTLPSTMKIAQSFFRQLGSRAGRRQILPHSQGICGRQSLITSVSSDFANNVTFQPVFAAAPSPRCFSSGPTSSLMKILASEEKEEKTSGNTKMPEELQDLKSSIEENWKIVEDGAMTSLFRKEHSHQVQVSFHCQDTEEDAMMDEDMEEFDEGEEPSPAVRFTVTVTKAGKSLVFACLSEYGSCRIDGVSTTAATVESVHDNQGTLAKREYQGPDFLELAEELQEELLVFLEEECGVNNDVTAFIAMFSDYREQACYVNWLKETQTILS